MIQMIQIRRLGCSCRLYFFRLLYVGDIVRWLTLNICIICIICINHIRINDLGMIQIVIQMIQIGRPVQRRFTLVTLPARDKKKARTRRAVGAF